MFKLILVLFFFLLTISPTFAIIEFRDTTPVQICDTIIYKKGIVAVVKILAITDTHVTFKLCDDTTNRPYTVKRKFINDIRAKQFPTASAGYEVDVYIRKAQKAFKTAIGLFGVLILLRFLITRLEEPPPFGIIFLLTLIFIYIFVVATIVYSIYFIYLSLKAIRKKKISTRYKSY